MYKKTIVIAAILTAKVSFGVCQLTQVPQVNFNCPPSMANTCSTNSTMNIYCSSSTSFVATLSNGVGGSYVPRAMKSGNNHLYYNIYLDPNQAKIFGDGTQATYTLNTTCQDVCSYQLFAYTAGDNNPKAGTYLDNLILNINY